MSDAVRKSSTILSAFTRGSDASMIGTFARNEGGFKLIVEETEKWGKVVKFTGLKPE